MGYEYTYARPGVSYYPLSDSIRLGDGLTLYASAPKSFFDSSYKINVAVPGSIYGPLGISKMETSPYYRFAGAIDDMDLTPVIGTVKKDSLLTSEQLKMTRLAFWDTSSADSLVFKLNIIPRIRGTFFINLQQQSFRDKDCALFKYFLRVKNNDQHFYLMTPVTNGEISENAANYTYCFKVY
jgi:hypothetical protein